MCAAVGQEIGTGRIGRAPASVATVVAPSLGKSGEMLTKDFALQLALEGRCYHAQIGDATTQVDFVETTYDEDQPQFALTIPSAITVIPLSIHIAIEDATGTDNLCAISRTTNDIGAGTSTALTISNMRSDENRNSGCNAYSLYTGNATAATGLVELARYVFPFANEADTDPMRISWMPLAEYRPVVLKGPATLQFHLVATTNGPEGFAEICWAELDTADALD